MQKRYERACDWRPYRLKNCSAVNTAEGNRRTRRIAQEFKRCVDHKFTGSDPAAIVWFLDRFIRDSKYIGVNERDSVWFIIDYLDTAPKEMVFNLIATMSTAENRDVPYIRIFSELLRSYALENVLHDTTEEM